MARFAVITVSDTRRDAEDRSGPVLVELLQEHFECEAATIFKTIVQDEVADIQAVVKQQCSQAECELVVLTGGTGLSQRDVTPDALIPLFDKRAPGIEALLLTKSLEVTAMAALARYTAGIRSNTLVLALPGSPKAARECFGFVAKVLSHAIATVRGVQRQVVATHADMQRSGTTASSSTTPTQPTSTAPDYHHGCHCVAPTATTEPWTGPVPSAIFTTPAARNRQSPYPLITLDDAFKVLDSHCAASLPVVEVNVRESLGHVLAQDVYSQWDMPPFRASIKDGYAVRVEDCPGQLAVSTAAPAGSTPTEAMLSSNCAVRVSTGGPIPPGATAVVMVEDTTLVDSLEGEEVSIEVTASVTAGQDIRPQGCDISKGQLLLRKGHLVEAADLALMLSSKLAQVAVYRQPRVLVLSTGNEVVDADPQPGQIIDSNRPMLLALLRHHGYSVVDGGILPDDPALIKAGLESAMASADYCHFWWRFHGREGLHQAGSLSVRWPSSVWACLSKARQANHADNVSRAYRRCQGHASFTGQSFVDICYLPLVCVASAAPTWWTACPASYDGCPAHS
eukprot:m.213277 g.213277  ORF g.213277 m.213277 type:complete len:567 (-) comp17175_c0_seq1:2338-4038(-)